MTAVAAVEFGHEQAALRSSKLLDLEAQLVDGLQEARRARLHVPLPAAAKVRQHHPSEAHVECARDHPPKSLASALQFVAALYNRNSCLDVPIVQRPRTRPFQG